MFAGGVGFFLNFASLQCVAAAGPTTYAMLGSFNKVPITILGVFLFHAPITADAAFFVVVSLAGGFLYSYAKIRTSSEKNDKDNNSHCHENKKRGNMEESQKIVKN